jgi:peptidoglycan/xylan/chitin deacetylase (PgdA/CDA1 family)
LYSEAQLNGVPVFVFVLITAYASTVLSAAVVPPFLEIPFDETPTGSLQDSVALTFDDGPDAEGHTNSILDTLRDRGVKATFFINTHSTPLCDEGQSQARAHAALRRMFEEGHEVGNHTAHHSELKDLTASEIEQELDGVDAAVANLMHRTDLHLTLFRTPYGRPMYLHDRAATPELFSKVADIIGPRGLHIGWNIDTNDWREKTVEQLVADVRASLDAGKRGIILMHSVHQRTAQALPAIIDLIQNEKGLRIVTCEAYVEQSYGSTSNTLFD